MVRGASRRLAALAIGAAYALCGCDQPLAPFVAPDFTELECSDYASLERDGAILYNNVWNKSAAGDFDWRQCIISDGAQGEPTYGWYWNWPNATGNIYAQPQIKVGSSPWDPLPKIDDRFPLALNRADKLEISHKLRVQTNGNFNIATTLWLVDDPDFGDKQNRSVIRAEVMFWTYTTEGQMDPAGKRVGTVEQGGKTWSIWLDREWGDASGVNDNRWIYLAFKAQDPSFESRFDAAELLRAQILEDLGLEEFYVADVELGTEIMNGEGVAWVDNFDVKTATSTSN